MKHFADYDLLKTVNIDGVLNLIDLCLKKKARLIQTSTVSVSGEALEGSVTGNVLVACARWTGRAGCRFMLMAAM